MLSNLLCTTTFCWLLFSINGAITRVLNDATKLRLLSEIDTNADELILVECSIKNELFYVQARPDWSPLGANRFIELVNDNVFEKMALFRAINDFLVQFGIPDNLDMENKWRVEHNMKDDPKIPISAKFESKIGFIRGMMSYAGSGLDTRSTQMFFTLVKETDWLGREAWETPFAMIIDNIDILTKINVEYDDGPQQGLIWQQGYEYLRKEFPNLTYLDYCNMVDQGDLDALSISLSMKVSHNNDNNNKDNGNVGGGDNDANKVDIVEDNSKNVDNSNNKDATPDKPREIRHDMSIDEIRAKLREKRDKDSNERHPPNGQDTGINDKNIGQLPNDNNNNDNVNENENNKNENNNNNEKSDITSKKTIYDYVKDRDIMNEDQYAQSFSYGVQIFEFFAIIILIAGIIWGVLRIRKGEKQA